MSFKIDFSKLPELSDVGKTILSSLENSVNENFDAFKGGSAALASSAERTGEIALGAVSDVLTGKIDLIGAERVARRAIDQSIDLAKGGANLLAVTSLNTLKEFALGIVKLAPGLLKIG